jgi:hypothetical protein
VNSILDPSFVYVPADRTRIWEKFAQIDPEWNQRPAHLEPCVQVRNRINGWTEMQERSSD